MPVRIRPRRRILRSLTGQSISKEAPGPAYSTAVKAIMANVEYPRLLDALRAGTSVKSLTEWFDREGWLGDLSPSTFSQYVYKFKAEQADLVRYTSSDTYDNIVGATLPDIDEEAELDKLILLQKRRLTKDAKTELDIGKLLDNTHKEVTAMGALLELKRKFRTGSDEGPKANDSAALRSLRVNEGEQDVMQDLTDQLFKAVRNANNPKKKTRQTVKVSR